MLFDDDLTQKQQSWYLLTLIKRYCKQGNSSKFKPQRAYTNIATWALMILYLPFHCGSRFC
jgi:hypothetical protein